MSAVRKRRRKRGRQALLRFANSSGHFHGGYREGAGRKPVRGRRSRVAHTTREALASRYPVHVTIRLREGLPSLRNLEVDEVLRRCFCAMKQRAGFKLVHYSIQTNHLHLIVEAQGKVALSRGMQSLCIRIAKALNRHWRRKGTIFADRYHAQILRSARQVRNAIVYVLTNAWRHGAEIRAALDRFASGWCFRAWREKLTVKNAGHIEVPVEDAGTYLLAKAWRRHGLISIHERAKAQPT